MDRRGFMAAAGGGLAASGSGTPVRAGTRETTFLVAHGAWSAGWAWKMRLRNGDTKIPRTYIYCKRINPEDTFRVFAERARREHWTYHEIDSSHSPHITAPDALLALLLAQA